jgi:hypothetical protein
MCAVPVMGGTPAEGQDDETLGQLQDGAAVIFPMENNREVVVSGKVVAFGKITTCLKQDLAEYLPMYEAACPWVAGVLRFLGGEDNAAGLAFEFEKLRLHLSRDMPTAAMHKDTKSASPRGLACLCGLDRGGAPSGDAQMVVACRRVRLAAWNKNNRAGFGMSSSARCGPAEHGALPRWFPPALGAGGNAEQSDEVLEAAQQQVREALVAPALLPLPPVLPPLVLPLPPPPLLRLRCNPSARPAAL